MNDPRTSARKSRRISRHTQDDTRHKLSEPVPKRLTAKQKQFAEEYLIDLNAAQAAIRAGYSRKTARSIGQRLLTNVDIKRAIDRAMSERAERTKITADNVLQELALLGFSNMQDYTTIINHVLSPDFASCTREQMAAVQDFTVEIKVERDETGKELGMIKKFRFKLADKRATLVNIGRHLGMFTDKVELNGNLTLPEMMRKANARIGRE